MNRSFSGNQDGRSGHFLDELRATFADRAGQPAIVYEDRSWTYGELDVKARRCAARLRQLGVVRGDRVAIATSEKLPFLAAHLGTLHAAAVSLPLNPWLTGDELRAILRDSGARVVVAGWDVHSIVNALRADLPGLRALMLDSEAWEAPEAEFSEPAIDRNAACLILYDSGSTGRHQGCRPHARQPRRQPAGTPDGLAIHARRHADQRLAPVPPPRTLRRRTPEPVDGQSHAH